jgi:hypothetical protein
MPQETPEAKAKRLERRKAHIEQQKRSKISHLSGLSDMELEAIQAARRANSTSSKESFIFSNGDISPDKRNYMEDLNEYDRKQFENIERSTKERRKGSSRFVFGF